MRRYVTSGVVDRIREAGGEVYAITSEPQRLADSAQDDWGLNFECVGDPHHEISGVCRDTGLLDIIVNPKTELFERDTKANYSHPKGYFQPGVLVIEKSGRVLYRWRGIPTRRNMGGATERPTAEHVLEKLEAARSDTGGGDAALDKKPVLDQKGIPWPLFVSVLTAHGWFIRPLPFPHKPGGPSIQRRFLGAAARIPFFIAAWVLAFVYLPTLWVGVALAAWAIWLTPHVRHLGDQFQNVSPDQLE